MGIGIYSLEFGNGSYYIGQSTNIEARFYDHLYELKLNKHFNFKVQNTYNTYGEPTFNVVCYCTLAELDKQEVQYIDLQDLKCLNIKPGGSVARGELAPRAKYKDENIEKAFLMLVKERSLTHQKIADLLSINVDTVHDISACRGRGSAELREKYPELYSILEVSKARNTKGSFSATLYNKSLGKFVTLSSGEFSRFCREYGVQSSNLSKVVQGKRKSTLGWELYECEVV